jgi:predicted ABC-type ATPase
MNKNVRSTANDIPDCRLQRAGQATFAKEFLPKEVKCLRFLNADEIARGLSPLKPSAGAVRAARLLLKQQGIHHDPET